MHRRGRNIRNIPFEQNAASEGAKRWPMRLRLEVVLVLPVPLLTVKAEDRIEGGVWHELVDKP